MNRTSTHAPARDSSTLKGPSPLRSLSKIDATLGERVRAAREAQRISQQALAGEIGVSQVRISTIECGSHSVSLSTAVKLARALDVSLDYLAGLSAEFGVFPGESE